MLTFSAKDIYSALNGAPVFEFLRRGGDDAGEEGKDEPEVAPDRVSLLRSVFVQAPNVDNNCAVETTNAGLNGRVHFFRYATPSTGVGGIDNLMGIVHVCHDYLNDSSAGHTTGNLAVSESDYEAADLSRAIRTVFPAAAALCRVQ